MFLDFIVNTVWPGINAALSWFECYSGTFATIVVVSAGSAWMFKYKKQKRIDATHGFYIRMYFCIKHIEEWLKKKKQLDPEKMNIYSLRYTDDTMRGRGDYKLNGYEQKELGALADVLLKTITESDNNISPKKNESAAWYDSKKTIWEMCIFIDNLNNKLCAPPNNNARNDDGTYKDTEECKKLKTALECINKSLEKSLYKKRDSLVVKIHNFLASIKTRFTIRGKTPS
jgi:hypothetical protein